MIFQLFEWKIIRIDPKKEGKKRTKWRKLPPKLTFEIVLEIICLYINIYIYIYPRFSHFEFWLYSIRAIASICANIFDYFSIKTYFFYSTQSFFQNLHIKLSILHYISFIYQFFLIFFSCFFFFTHSNYHPLSSFIFEICKEKMKNTMQNE